VSHHLRVVPPPDFKAAIHAQPMNLEGAARAFEQALAGFDAERLASGTLVLSGVGASAIAVIPAVRALRAAGRRAFAVSSAELVQASAAGLGDAYVLVSQSGASVETLDALAALDGAPLVAVTARGSSPLAGAADLWLPLGPLPDTPVATLSYTATLQALGMLCDLLIGGELDPVWPRLPSLVADVLERSLRAVDHLAESFAAVRAVDAAGGGSGAAAAYETALLAREALKLPAMGMETREYLHGPLEAVGPEFGCVLFGRERELALAQTLESYGATVALVTDLVDGAGPGVVALPRVPDLAAAVLQILPAQLLVERTARLRGLTIGPLARHQDDTKVAV
jgi:glucosamine--fructose-6-phosphate aminotransferase (isomerizing)